MDAEKQNGSNIYIPQIKQIKVVEEREGGESRSPWLTFTEVSGAENNQSDSSFGNLV